MVLLLIYIYSLFNMMYNYFNKKNKLINLFIIDILIINIYILKYPKKNISMKKIIHHIKYIFL